MAAGNINKSGKPTDIVRHYFSLGTNFGLAACGRSPLSLGYTTSVWEEVTCKNCLSKKSRYEK